MPVKLFLASGSVAVSPCTFGRTDRYMHMLASLICLLPVMRSAVIAYVQASDFSWESLDCLVRFRSERKTLWRSEKLITVADPARPVGFTWLWAPWLPCIAPLLRRGLKKTTNHHWLVTCLSLTTTRGICGYDQTRGYGHAKTIFRSLVQTLTTRSACACTENSCF